MRDLALKALERQKHAALNAARAEEIRLSEGRRRPRGVAPEVLATAPPLAAAEPEPAVEPSPRKRRGAAA